MSKYDLLRDVKAWLETITADREYVEDVQKGDEKVVKRSPEIHRMRLPNSSHAKKYAPYIIVQLINWITSQPDGLRSEAKATVRLIFCVQNENEEEGALDLLNLMEAVERELLKDPFYGKSFTLDREAGLEAIIYPDDTRPYYAGEIVGTFVLPETERNVTSWLRN